MRQERVRGRRFHKKNNLVNANMFIGVNFTPEIISPEQQKTLEFCLQIFHCIFVIITDDGVSHCSKLQSLFRFSSHVLAPVLLSSVLEASLDTITGPGLHQKDLEKGTLIRHTKRGQFMVCLNRPILARSPGEGQGGVLESVYSFP